jgi:threonine synthase
MLYKSTRGSSNEVPFSEVLLGGLAPDGGLYMPEHFPTMTLEQINDMDDLEYHELASKILFPFVEGEISELDFSSLVEETYRVFDTRDVVNLVELEKEQWVLELFHGPTLAFKDVAMQLLGALLDYFSKKQGKRIAVLGATSGDTGAAAISACSRYSNVDVFILYPHGRVTEVQRRQMTTSQAKNVHVLAVKTDFDGCQAMVKDMFLDDSMIKEGTRLISANSINWTRCMTQSVYFFWSYLKLKDTTSSLSFSIPSGNFGHAYAGWTAKQIGLPIDRLLVATNSNDVLHKLFSNNLYEKTNVNQTLAPSMDISVASNFERLLYNLYNDNPDLLLEAMNIFKSKSIQIPHDRWPEIQEIFPSLSSNDEQIISQIKETFSNHNYLLDPHTATGIRAANNLALKGETIVTMATAHPAKFIDAMKNALPEHQINDPSQLKLTKEREEVFSVLPNNLNAVKDYVRTNLK